MDNRKIKFLSILLIILLGIIFSDNIINLLTNDKLQLETVVLYKGDYYVDKDIAAGTYDIEVISGNIIFNGKDMSVGDKIISNELEKKSFISVDGDGSIMFSPSQPYKLSINNGIYKIENSGFYSVGEHLAPGKYKLTIHSDEINFNPHVQLLSKKNRDVIETYDFADTNSLIISLDTSNIFEIHKELFKEIKNAYITLELLE